MKKNSIISIIIILLILLTAILFFRGCNQEGSEMKTYSVAGTYTETATYQNGEIKVSGVNIENATFTGNLAVTDAVVDGDTRLTNSSVQGELQIKGGGTIYLDGGTYQTVTVEKTDTKIILLGEAKVENLNAKSPCSIVAGGQCLVKSLTIDKAASKTTVLTQENGVIENIQSRGISDIVLNTPSKLVGFGTGATGSTLTANATVEKIATESKVALTLNANVASLILTKTGEDTAVTLGNNAVIISLGTEARVDITGEGSVTNATTNDPLFITGSITPDVVYITTKPVVTDSNGGLSVSTNTSRQSTSGSGSSSTWYFEESASSSMINSKYDAPPLNPCDSPAAPDVPTTVSVTSIQITPVEADVLMGNTLKLNVVVFPENATNKNVTWETSDPNIATVNNGVISPVSNGKVTITARTEDGSKTDTSLITVKTNITAVTMINTINASNNSIAETIPYDSSYNLPNVVIVQGYDNEVFPCPVTWSPGTADTKQVGVTSYNGTLVPPANYLNLNSIQATIRLTVLPQPVISASSAMTSQRIYINEDPSPIAVNASVTEGHVLTYTWYQRIGDQETLLTDVTGPTYDPPVSTAAGTVYYSCTVTTDQAEPVTVFAGTIVTIARPTETTSDATNSADPAAQDSSVLAELPTITAEPTNLQASSVKDQTASTDAETDRVITLSQATNKALAVIGSPTSTTNDESIVLSVEANVNDGGTLSYQWFKNTVGINAGGTAITDATDKTLSVDPSEECTTAYYYVEITNQLPNRLPAITVSAPVAVYPN